MARQLSNEKCAVIYSRYSSHAQRDVSIDQQVKECKKYAEKLDLKVIGIYADRALTGTNDRRPDFQRMISDAEKGAFAYVIVYTLDRFARDRYDSAVYKRQLRNCGVKVLSAMENISDDPTGVLMESMLEGLAEYYSKELSRKILRGMRDNAEKCIANGSVPFGYRRGSDGKYVIVEEQAVVVQEIFTRFSGGESFTSIAKDLNQRGITTKTGVAWNRSSFRIMMVNERYTGVYIHRDVRIEGGIPQIISKELFDRVQLRLKNKPIPRNNPQKRRRPNSVYLLTGKLYCGKCKTPMVGISGKSGSPTPYYYYICRKRLKEKACDKGTVRREWAEYQVAAAIHEYVLNDDVINWLADSVVEYLAKNGEPAEVKILRTQLSDTRKALKNVMSAIEQGVITNTTKARLSELESQESELAAHLAIAENKPGSELSRDQIITWLLTFRDGDIKDKAYQELLFDTFLVAAYLYDDHFRIVFNYTGETKEVDIPFDLDNIDNAADSSTEVRISENFLHHVAADVISFAATFYQKPPLTHFVATPFQIEPTSLGFDLVFWVQP